MAVIARLANNLKTLLSTSKKSRYENADDEGRRSPVGIPSQHGSGSKPVVNNGMTPERGEILPMGSLEEQGLADITDNDYNAKIDQTLAELLSLKRPTSASQAERESNPISVCSKDKRAKPLH